MDNNYFQSKHLSSFDSYHRPVWSHVHIPVLVAPADSNNNNNNNKLFHLIATFATKANTKMRILIITLGLSILFSLIYIGLHYRIDFKLAFVIPPTKTLKNLINWWVYTNINDNNNNNNNNNCPTLSCWKLRRLIDMHKSLPFHTVIRIHIISLGLSYILVLAISLYFDGANVNVNCNVNLIRSAHGIIKYLGIASTTNGVQSSFKNWNWT